MGWCLILIGLLLRERPFATRLHEELLSQADVTTLQDSDREEFSNFIISLPTSKDVSIPKFAPLVVLPWADLSLGIYGCHDIVLLGMPIDRGILDFI